MMRKVEPLSSQEPFLWGKQRLSFDRAREHFLVLGSTGSGKTVLLKRLMGTVLPRVGGETLRCRALVYDAKKDMYEELLSMGVREELIAVVNPFDARSTAWDIAADVRTLPEATELATLLIPREREAQPFFSNTARAILRGIIEALILHVPEKWTLRHVLLACEDEDVLKRLLNSHVSTRGTLSLMRKEQTWLDIKATLDSYLYRYRFIAAAWERAGKKFSIKEWLTKREFIILLGNDDNARSEIDTINRLFFNKMAQLINDQSVDVRGQETWIFLDEVREAGKLDNLRSLLLRARSKNCAVVLGFQDILGMESVYGREEARELLGCPANVAILHLNHNAFDARKWASDIFGEAELKEVSQNQSTSGEFFSGLPSQKSTGTNINIRSKPIYMPFKFYELRRAGNPEGMDGVFIGKDRFGEVHFTHEELFEAQMAGDASCDGVQPCPLSRNYVARSPADFDLKPWEEADSIRLPGIAAAFQGGQIMPDPLANVRADPLMDTDILR